MKIIQVAFAFLLLALILSATGFNKYFAASSVKPQGIEVRAETHQARQYPEHVRYEFLLRKIQFLVSKDIPDYRLAEILQDEYGLDTEQTKTIKQVAIYYLEQVRLQDKKAQEIILRDKAKYSKGVIPKGQQIPIPPLELMAMQQERNGLFMSARSYLQTSFGTEAFQRFDEKLKGRIKVPGLSPTTMPIQQ